MSSLSAALIHLRLPFCAAVICLAVIGIGRHRRGHPLTVHLQVFAGLAAVLAAAADTGGLHSGILVALVVFPVYGGYALGMPAALKYGGIAVGLILGLLGLEAAGVVFTNVLAPREEHIFTAATMIAALIALIGAAAAFADARHGTLLRLAATGQELTLARNLAKAATRVKAQFLADMNAEIRAPMTAVIGRSEMLLETPLSTGQRDHAEAVRDGARGLLTIINDILDLATVESGGMELELLDLDLRDTVEDVARLLSVQAHEKGLEITVQIDPTLPDFVRGDAGRIRQILLTLGGNAIKYTHSGEVSLDVQVVDRNREGTCVRCEVLDTGIGIPADRLTGLFTSAAHGGADATAPRQPAGTGLGLSIAKHLVELMGGETGADSESGMGAVFWFAVRFAPARNARDLPSLQKTALSGQRVLLVDDNSTNRRVLMAQLLRCGTDPICADSGDEAVSIMREARAGGRPIEVALLDHQMPGCDGSELGRRILQDDGLRSTRLVLLTSSGKRGDGRLFANIGFAGYLQKPVAQRDLIECLMVVLAQSAAAWRSQTQPIVTRHQLRAQRSRGMNRVLLAEDDILNQRVVVRLLEKLGYRVDVVADGWAAITQWQTGRYGLIMMDCRMPELDGYEAAAEIRRLEPGGTHRVPIVALMGRGLSGSDRLCMDAGMDDVLFKPITREKLVACLDQHLGAPSAAMPRHSLGDMP